MKRYTDILRFAMFFGCILIMTNLSFGQTKWNLEDDGCGGVRWRKGLYGNNEDKLDLVTREFSLSAIPERLNIEGSKNGGVRVKGWDKNEVTIKVCIQTRGKTDEEAKKLSSAVNIKTDDGTIKAVSPYSDSEDVIYSVNYDIKIPKKLNLNIMTLNGGINVSEIESVIDFNVSNGGAVLHHLAGDVSGRINNGNVMVKLAGKEWIGNGINIRIAKGDVLILLPEDYSARVETGTRRGNLISSIGGIKQSVKNDNLNLDVGSGGALLNILTDRGNVLIQK